MKNNYDVVVIGAGVAGMTAALYLKRSGLNPIIIEKSAPGGQINRSALVENYPGFTNIDGPTLAANIFTQVNNLGIEYKSGNVKEIINNNDNNKQIVLENEVINTKTIIIATGRHPRELGLSNEKSLTGRGISWCAICDGYFFKDQEVAVVGGGDSALEETLFLSSICKKVYLIHRRDTFKASEQLQSKIKKLANVEFILNSKIVEIKEKNNKLASIIIETYQKQNKELLVSGLFIYIGSVPDTQNFKSLNIFNENGYIKVDKNYETSIKGIFACGDVIDKNLYQLTTAVGDASTAAFNLKKIYFS